MSKRVLSGGARPSRDPPILAGPNIRGKRQVVGPSTPPQAHLGGNSVLAPSMSAGFSILPMDRSASVATSAPESSEGRLPFDQPGELQSLGEARMNEGLVLVFGGAAIVAGGATIGTVSPGVHSHPTKPRYRVTRPLRAAIVAVGLLSIGLGITKLW